MKEIEKIRVVVDTNEKLNYSFKLHPKIQPISRHMESGDYCLENFENSCSRGFRKCPVRGEIRKNAIPNQPSVERPYYSFHMNLRPTGFKTIP